MHLSFFFFADSKLLSDWDQDKKCLCQIIQNTWPFYIERKAWGVMHTWFIIRPFSLQILLHLYYLLLFSFVDYLNMNWSSKMWNVSSCPSWRNWLSLFSKIYNLNKIIPKCMRPCSSWRNWLSFFPKIYYPQVNHTRMYEISSFRPGENRFIF